MTKKQVLLLCVSIILPFLIIAGGFQVSMHSHKSVGMGLCGTSNTTDASSMFYNPGALSLNNQNLNVLLGSSLLISNTAFKGESPNLYTSVSENPLNFPSYLYISKKVSKRVTIGLAAYTPYGSSSKWDDKWQGRYLARKTSLLTLFVQPTISLKINDKIGVGVGLVYAFGMMEQSRALPVSSSLMADGSVSLKGSASSWGFNAGILYKPIPKLGIGLNYRSSVNLKINGGKAEFVVPTSVALDFPKNNKFNTEIPLPANINLGAHYEFSDKLIIALQIDYTFWNIYDTTLIDFANNTESLSDSKTANKYNNSFAFRAGGQYQLKKIIVRAGGYFDFAATDAKHINPQNPCSNQIGLSMGASVNIVKHLSLDISYLYVNNLKRKGSYEAYGMYGSYQGTANILGMGLSLTF